MEEFIKIIGEAIDYCFKRNIIRKVFSFEVSENEDKNLLISICTDSKDENALEKNTVFDLNFFDFFRDKDEKKTKTREQLLRCVSCLCEELQRDIYKKEHWFKIELKNGKLIYCKKHLTFDVNFAIIEEDLEEKENGTMINKDMISIITRL